MDPAEVPATDFQDLVAHVRGYCHADGVDHGLVEMQQEQVAIVLALFASVPSAWLSTNPPKP